MKKLMMSLLCLLLVGCSNVSKEEYEQLIEEKKALQVSYNSIKKELQDLQIYMVRQQIGNHNIIIFLIILEPYSISMVILHQILQWD